MADTGTAVSIGAELWGIIKSAAVFAVAGLGWLFRRQVHRVDALEKAHNDLAAQVMTKGEFTGAINSLRTEIASGLDRVVGEIRHQSTRIDGLYKKGKSDE